VGTVVVCPTCQRPVEWSPASPHRPFCSERCKLIDFGAWVGERRVIPGESLSPADEGDPDVGESPPRH
jgi:endogenous inhibitor of DNA gyrase (YacG/DUF329 family)